MISVLPPVDIPGHFPSGLGGPDHPMRHVTRQAAGLAPGGWDAQTRAHVSQLFDMLAGEWHTRVSEAREAVVADVLARGGPWSGRAVEVGSGIGAYSTLLAQHFDVVVAVDLAWEMLVRAPAAAAPRVLADAYELPLPAGSVSSVVLVNAFLFPAEVDRVLDRDGAVVWVNSSGEETPIHLTSDEVATALPGSWSGVESRAGAATWCVLRRDRSGST